MAVAETVFFAVVALFLLGLIGLMAYTFVHQRYGWAFTFLFLFGVFWFNSVIGLILMVIAIIGYIYQAFKCRGKKKCDLFGK